MHVPEPLATGGHRYNLALPHKPVTLVAAWRILHTPGHSPCRICLSTPAEYFRLDGERCQEEANELARKAVQASTLLGQCELSFNLRTADPAAGIAQGWTIRGSNPARGEIFPTCPRRVSFPGVKRPG